MYGSVILYNRVFKKLQYVEPVSNRFLTGYITVRFVVSVSVLIQMSFELQVLPNSAYSCKQTENFNEINHLFKNIQ